MSSLTPADALIRASDDLVKALNGLIPTKGRETEAVDHLMKIVKQQVVQERGHVDTQRVLKDNAQDQRVPNKNSAQNDSTINEEATKSIKSCAPN